MSMRKSILMTMLTTCALVATQASAEDKPSRMSAPLPAPIGDKAELTPASPMVTETVDVSKIGTDGQYGIGVAATDNEIAAIDIDIMPDGRGLPAGSGTYEQGMKLYGEKCASCHGEKLEGNADLGAPKLIGGRDSLASDKPVKTVESYWPYASTLFDYMRRAMPMNEPGSLTNDEVYAISAYVLGEAGIADKSTALDAKSFAKIKMPNADGFIPDPRKGDAL